MPAITVKLERLRQAPRKVRLVIDLVRGQSLAVAHAQIGALPKRAARPVGKLLRAAEAAAAARGLDTDGLWIKTVTCDQGAALKRRRLNSRGRASLVKKLSSHITLTVSDEAPKGRAGRNPFKVQSSNVKSNPKS